MRISTIHIENYRSFKNEIITLDNYSCFVGPNGAGKSTVLSALNVFFQNATSGMPNVKELDEEDFNNKDTANPIRITLTFVDLNPAAQQSFKDYVRHGKLIVTAEAHWNPESRSAMVSQRGKRMGIKVFAEQYFSKLASSKVAELKPVYNALRITNPELPLANTGQAMTDALRGYEAAHVEQCEEIDSLDEFYGSNDGKLKPFVQWVYVPAVKDVQEEGEETKRSALGQLLARTVGAKTNIKERLVKLRADTTFEFERLLAENKNTLDDLTVRLQKRLGEWAHTETNLDIRWMSDPKSVQVNEPLAGVYTGEGDFTGKLARMGHGLQRSYLLALLTELAGAETENAPTLILGCEEPELYQHPPQARRLADVFRDLSTKNTQVVVTTHSPYFVSGKGFENVRLIRREKSGRASIVNQTSAADLTTYLNSHTFHRERPVVDGLRAKIHQSLQPGINEMFFCSYPVFVEGLEDVAFITTALHLYGHWEKFHASGCHLIPSNGKHHLIHPIALANKLQIPYFLIFDCDKNCRPQDVPKHEADNKTLFSLIGAATSDAFPSGGLSGTTYRCWELTMGKAIESDFDKKQLCQYMQKARNLCGHATSLSKNAIFISEWLTEAHKNGEKSEILDLLCTEIISGTRVST